MKPPPANTYYVLSITGLDDIGSELAERISALAWESGCTGVEEHQGAQTAWRIYFADVENAGACRDALLKLMREMGIAGAHIDLEARPVENWMAGWREHFQPVRVGVGFLIAPPWWTAEGEDDGRAADMTNEPLAEQGQSGDWRSQGCSQGRAIIRIEPGMAFGTGTHATTQLCLELAEPHLRSGLRVLDVGTGSGILAIAAARHGAARAVALDSDPDTVENFRLNLQLNKITLRNAANKHEGNNEKQHKDRKVAQAAQVFFILSEGLSALKHLKYDLVFANLLAPHIETLLAQMRERRFASPATARPLIIGSGLLAEEWPGLRAGWEACYGLHVEREAFRAEWMAFAGRLG